MTSRRAQPRVRRVPTDRMTGPELDAIRGLMDEAFGSGEEAFGDDDWAHALGGLHVVLDVGGRIAAHAAVVERELRVGGRSLRTGYVEAVATAPDLQGTGLGTAVMGPVAIHIRDRYELGALGTGSHTFYERLGWRTWRGPSSVRLPDGRERPTPDEDGFIMVLLTRTTADLDLALPISCDWRPGDVW